MAKLLPSLLECSLPYKMLISEPGVTLDRISFPKHAVISAVARMRNGTEVEAALIGFEGFYGLQSVLGDGTSATAAMVQLADGGYTIPAEDFVAAIDGDRALNASVLRYAQVSIETIGQFCGCNRLHEIRERCARWLLMVHDRVGRDDMPLTHEFLATMLGVNRPTVSLATAEFARLGYIRNDRGSIVMLDRESLQKIACECYEYANGTLERLMGYRIRP